MGSCLSCCVPRKIIFKKFESNVNLKNSKIENIKEEIIYFSSNDFNKTFINKLNSIIKEYLKKSPLISRSGRFNVIVGLEEEERLTEGEDYEDFISVDKYFTIKEIEDYLNWCAKTELPNYSNINEQEKSKVQESLMKNEHITLCQYPNEFQRLKVLLQKSIQYHLFHKYLDKEDASGNSIVCVALIYRNIDALIYLIKTCFAKIPVTINIKGNEYLFLIYIAKMNDLIMDNKDMRPSLLYILIHELSKRFEINAESYNDYFCKIDQMYKISVLHCLVELYFTSYPIFEILNCIEICCKCYPSSLLEKCQLRNSHEFKTNVVGRIIYLCTSENVLAVNNIIQFIIQHFPDIIINGKTEYKILIEVLDKEKSIKESLLKLFI